MKDTVTDQFDAQIPSADALRLHMGEMTPDEVLVAKSAYRLALTKALVPQETIGKLIQTLENAEGGLRDLARFADEHGSCSSHAIEHVAAEISKVLKSPGVRFIPRKDSRVDAEASRNRQPSFPSR